MSMNNVEPLVTRYQVVLNLFKRKLQSHHDEDYEVDEVCHNFTVGNTVVDFFQDFIDEVAKLKSSRACKCKEI